ncbi:hypothetical protein BDZ89DRAFT_1074285 [Hymenopellis radicata]|nr:hypothetical protein BDZ89DRAFT_1074285 [Hymenopellis radicata]
MEGTDARGCAGAGPRTVMDNGISNSKWSERMEGPNARGCAEAVPGTVGNDDDEEADMDGVGRESTRQSQWRSRHQGETHQTLPPARIGAENATRAKRMAGVYLNQKQHGKPRMAYGMCAGCSDGCGME